MNDVERKKVTILTEKQMELLQFYLSEAHDNYTPSGPGQDSAELSELKSIFHSDFNQESVIEVRVTFKEVEE